MKRLLTLSYLFYFSLLLTITIQITCSKKTPEDQQETILVRIGDKSISVNEFLRRAEYTIRPPYCKLDNYIHKKIILNSLIAEKLFALEGEKQSQLLQSEKFNALMKGLQEQAIRQWLYHEKAYKKVTLDDEEIKKTFRLAGRTYKLAHFSLSDSTKSKELASLLRNQELSFEDAFYELSGSDSLFIKNVAWKDRENTRIHQALFTDELQNNQILGPIKISDDQFLFAKILGWTDRKVITDTDIQRRHNDVVEYLTDAHAAQIWKEYTGQIMQGKKIEFDRATFEQIFDLMLPLYFRTNEEITDAFSQKMWHDKDVEIILPDMSDKNFRNRPFFTIDDQVWTVGDFAQTLESHPLVFRQRRIPKSEFAEQLKLAIVDMVKDQYLNKQAYKESLDKISLVKRNTAMWRDSFIALEQRNEYFKAKGVKQNFQKEYMFIIRDHLNAYVDSLQAKYSDQIEINMDQFEQLNLTKIDLVVKYTNVPYPMVVPAFPILTDDTNLEYGRIMIDR